MSAPGRMQNAAKRALYTALVRAAESDIVKGGQGRANFEKGWSLLEELVADGDLSALSVQIAMYDSGSFSADKAIAGESMVKLDQAMELVPARDAALVRDVAKRIGRALPGDMMMFAEAAIREHRPGF